MDSILCSPKAKSILGGRMTSNLATDVSKVANKSQKNESDTAETQSVETQVEQLVQTTLRNGDGITGIRAPKKELEAKALERIQKAGTLRGRPLFYNYMGSGVGRGPYVELEDGSVKLDLINGIGIHVLGHSHPRVMAATVRGALSDVVMQGILQPNKEYLALNEKLAKLAAKNSRLKYTWLATCGTMANENALKLARQKTKGARMIITFKNAFAGRSTMMAEVTDNTAYKVNLPDYNEVLRIPFYNSKEKNSGEKTLSALKEHVAKHEGKVGVFGFEPMLGEGGFFAANKEFFLPLLDFLKSKNIPIWADEVQTFTRTGEFFAYETLGIGQYIDICTIAKTAQNGATLYTEEMKPDAGLLGGTFAGSSASLSAGLEVLTILEEGGYMGANGRVLQIHKEFVGMLNKLNETTCKGLLREAGGMGLMVAVTPFDGSKEKQLALLKTLFKNGVICFGCGHDPYRVRFLLPAVLTAKDIDVAREVIEKSVLENS
jgi:4-aminobutyrate aminotransferase-like enzyme